MIDKSLTVQDLAAGFVLSMNEREYVAFVLLFPSEDAKDPEIRKDHAEGGVHVFGNIREPEKQVEILRAVANGIEDNIAEISKKTAEAKRKIATN